MKAIKRILVILLLGTAGFVAELKASASEYNFSVMQQLPDNQVDSSSYFNLLMHPGQTQTVSVQLTNGTDKKITVECAVASATTNLNGVVEYSPNDIKAAKSLQYKLPDLVKLPAEVTLEPKAVQQVDIQVAMPATSVKGVIAGGLTFKQKSSESENNKNQKKGVGLKNEYAYVVGFLMQQSTDEVSPELVLNSVGASQVNYRNVIQANLENTQPTYINQMVVNASVVGVSDKKIIYSEDKRSLQMAPNSDFSFPIPLKGERLKAGKYHLVMDVFGQKSVDGQYTIKNTDGKEESYKYKWHFEKDFTIAADVAKTLNEKDVTVKPDNSWLIWLVIAGILLLAALLIFLILWKRRKKENEDEANETGQG